MHLWLHSEQQYHLSVLEYKGGGSVNCVIKVFVPETVVQCATVLTGDGDRDEDELCLSSSAYGSKLACEGAPFGINGSYSGVTS